jgi:hypothetical protein
MESGLTEPSLTMLTTLAKAFAVTVAELVARADLDSTQAA